MNNESIINNQHSKIKKKHKSNNKNNQNNKLTTFKIKLLTSVNLNQFWEIISITLIQIKLISMNFNLFN